MKQKLIDLFDYGVEPELELWYLKNGKANKMEVFGVEFFRHLLSFNL